MRIVFVLVVLCVSSLVSGCFFPPTECLNVCSARHQSCVTRASSDEALQWCDYQQRLCMNQCHGIGDK